MFWLTCYTACGIGVLCLLSLTLLHAVVPQSACASRAEAPLLPCRTPTQLDSTVKRLPAGSRSAVRAGAHRALLQFSDFCASGLLAPLHLRPVSKEVARAQRQALIDKLEPQLVRGLFP